MWYFICVLGGFVVAWFIRSIKAAFAEERLMKEISQTFGIKPGINWSDERTRDFRSKVMVRLGVDVVTRERCDAIQEAIRKKQEDLG